MTIFRRIAHRWRQDSLLQKVIRSSAQLFSSNSISLGLSVVQSILAGRLLGPAGFGLLGIVIGYASTINGLFSFRMSELVVRYAGEYLERGEKGKTAAVIKAAALAEGLVSALAYLFLALTAALAARFIAKTPESVWLFMVYGLAILANFATETSTGVLQISERISLQGVLNLAQSAATLLVIALAFFGNGGLEVVLAAYLLGKIILGLGMFSVASRQLTRLLGRGWWQVPLSGLPPRRELARFALSSNLSATAILVFRESEVLWVGFFLSSAAAGYYKAAYALINLISVPANPLILTVYPEINRLVVQRAWPRLRDFLRKITTLSALYNLALAAGIVLFGKWLLGIYGEQYVVAYPALLALLVGVVFNYMLFWNRPLLLSLGLPDFPLKATLAAGLVKVGLAFPLVPRLGYVAEAALLSFYYVASVGAIVWRGLKEIKARARSEVLTVGMQR